MRIDFTNQLNIVDPFNTGKIGYDDFRILLYTSGLQ